MFPSVPSPVMGAEQTRNWIRTNTPRSAWETLSGAKILEAYKAQGMGIREQDFYEIRREVLQLGYYEEAIKARDKNQLIPRAWMHEVPKKVLTCNALYKYKIEVANLETGEVEIWTRALADDRHMTPQEVIDGAHTRVVSRLYEYNYELMHIDVSEVWIVEGSQLTR